MLLMLRYGLSQVAVDTLLMLPYGLFNATFDTL